MSTESSLLPFFSAAVRVLRATGRPLTTRQLTDEAIRQGLIHPSGRTPASTMSAALYKAVRDDPTCPIRRLFEPGAHRAVRNSVMWTVRSEATE
jgi:hypothetical protein